MCDGLCLAISGASGSAGKDDDDENDNDNPASHVDGGGWGRLGAGVTVVGGSDGGGGGLSAGVNASSRSLGSLQSHGETLSKPFRVMFTERELVAPSFLPAVGESFMVHLFICRFLRFFHSSLLSLLYCPCPEPLEVRTVAGSRRPVAELDNVVVVCLLEKAAEIDGGGGCCRRWP